jgi:hypothetical protein
MEKPYDEIIIDTIDLPQGLFGLGMRGIEDWAKLKFEADEVECFRSDYDRDITIRYKRYQLQYG